MMYVHQPSLAKLKKDLAQFIQSSTDQKSMAQKGDGN
jgi:hypothetical protein